MAFCKNCGAQLEDSTAFCPNCGTKVEASFAEAEQIKEQASQTEEKKFDLNNMVDQITDTPDSTDEFTQSDIDANKIYAVLAYIGILFLVPLLAAKESKFAQFHANQGIVLFLAGIACGVVNVIPLLGQIVSIIGYIAVAIFAILGIVNAATGKAKELPLIGQIKLIK